MDHFLAATVGAWALLTRGAVLFCLTVGVARRRACR